MAGRGAAFNRRVRDGLSDELTFAQRPEQNGGQILWITRGRMTLGEGTAQAKAVR